MKRPAVAICVLASAGCLILSSPGYDLPWVAWFALVPLFLVIRTARPGRAFLASFATSFLFVVVHLYWALDIRGFNVVNHTLINVGLSGWVGLFGVFACVLHRRLPGWSVVSFPAIWALIEYVRLHVGFLSFPWWIVGYSQYEVLPVIQVAGLTGVYGVSFLIVLANTVLAGIAERSLRTDSGSFLRPVFEVSLAGLVIGAALLFGTGRLAEPASDAPVARLALIQGNAFWTGSQEAKDRLELLEKYRQLTLEAAKDRPDLIAWPSDSVPAMLPREEEYGEVIAGIAREAATHLLVGSSGQEKFDALPGNLQDPANSAFLFSPAGEVVQHYEKIHLLPFDEYLPLRGYFAWPEWIARSRPTDFRPGTERTVFTAGESRFGVQICWENLFPDPFRRMAGQDIGFMVSMTNEGFVGGSRFAHEQMLAMNAMRAVENGIPVFRTSPTGISAAIDATGRIAARLRDDEGAEVGVAGHLVASVTADSERTFYTRNGDWFVGLLAVFAGALVVAPLRVPRFATRSGPVSAADARRAS